MRRVIPLTLVQKLFAHLLKRTLPRTYTHLEELGFPWSALTTSWLCCIYLNALPKPVVARVWDILFFEGTSTLSSPIPRFTLHRSLCALPDRDRNIQALRGADSEASRLFHYHAVLEGSDGGSSRRRPSHPRGT